MLPRKKTCALFFLYVLFFIFSGCSSLETHMHSFIPKEHYASMLEEYIKYEKQFLSARGHITLTREELAETFPCLRSQKPRFYETNVRPSDDPLPSLEVRGRRAALLDTGQDALWHMGNSHIGFTLFPESDAPFLVSVLCPIYIEQHYNQGPALDIAVGKKENRRGVLTYFIFTFKLEFISEESGDTTRERLINMSRGTEIPTTDVQVVNDWFTRVFVPMFEVLLGTSKSMLPFNVH